MSAPQSTSSLSIGNKELTALVMAGCFVQRVVTDPEVIFELLASLLRASALEFSILGTCWSEKELKC